VPATPRSLDTRAEHITSVVWATGFRTATPWLHVPVHDAQGDVRQRDGITPVRGLYTIGMRFQRVRKSSFIDGAGGDARFLARHIAAQSTLRAVA
jgi:putative flavoprotein involved in K+ transport